MSTSSPWRLRRRHLALPPVLLPAPVATIPPVASSCIYNSRKAPDGHQKILTRSLGDKTGKKVDQSDYGATPERLRVLENGWREKRRRLARAEKVEEPRTYRAVWADTPAIPERSVSCHQGLARRRSRAVGPSRDDVLKRQKAVLEPQLTTTVPLTTSIVAPTAQHSISRPLSPPPTPPASTILEGSSQRSHLPSETRLPGRPRASRRNEIPIAFKPITSGHLIPSANPIPVSSSSSVSIQVLPKDSEWEMVVSMPHTTVRVCQGGKRINITQSTRSEKIQVPRRSGTRSLHLDDVMKWSATDRETWRIIADMVEGYKRVTPRVKVWHQLGQLSIASSTPPDVILSINMCGPQMMTPSEIPPSTGPPKLHTKARVTYSRIQSTIRIDTSSTYGTYEIDPENSFRSRRVVRLSSSAKPMPSTRSIGTDPTQLGSSAPFQELGISLGVMEWDKWTQVEREAVRRLWEMRAYWERF